MKGALVYRSAQDIDVMMRVCSAKVGRDRVEVGQAAASVAWKCKEMQR